MNEAEELTKALGGRWHGHYGTSPCPVCQPERRGDQNALSLTKGHRGLLLNCKKSSCSFLDVLRAAKVPPQRQAPSVPVNNRQRLNPKSSQYAKKLWEESGPIKGSPAEVYLRQVRMVDLPSSPSLRFNPRVWHGLARLNLPAMIALIEGADDFAVSRTFLRSDGSGKAALSKHEQRLMLGCAAGGHVSLMTGGGSLIVAEGVETALSVLHLQPDRSASLWAALSAANIRNLRLPASPGHLVIATDGDDAGRSAGDALAARAGRQGWAVDLLPAPDGRDWNDVLVGRLSHAGEKAEGAAYVL